MPNLMKIRPVGAELFRADRQTDRQTDINDETNNRFSKFLRRWLITKKLLATVTVLRNYNLSCLVTVSGFFVAGIKEIMAKATARCYLRNVCLICIYRFSPSPTGFPVTFNRVGRLTHSCCPCPLPYRGALLSN